MYIYMYAYVYVYMCMYTCVYVHIQFSIFMRFMTKEKSRSLFFVPLLRLLFFSIFNLSHSYMLYFLLADILLLLSFRSLSVS